MRKLQAALKMYTSCVRMCIPLPLPAHFYVSLYVSMYLCIYVCIFYFDLGTLKHYNRVV